ncbi:hypothetical protein [Tropicimonas sp. IMCC6043]|uniref:hypothetical protein n=1 Tax=Tropicimonas sp. IMCC6043 TaxID=2510645 RepID=UPI00101CAB9B|nr:hypothetical protein [Tropicimonas sp. IMCC6043]RYH08695.1 hypothetical protein EU800_15715 [Tropicimonas sp. IMCC6043]
MKRTSSLAALAAALALLAAPAAAECFADYKAKRDNPLRLHYGTIRITGPDCTEAAAAAEIAPRIAVDGWSLLTVLGVFDATGLAERKQSAGPFHLRY